MMAEAVYVLCTCTSVLCAVLLLRGFRHGHSRLLLWSGLCFVGLACNNLLLFIDLVAVPSVDLSAFRSVTALAAVSILVFGMVWESR
jgi:hypothetical protein